MLKAIIFDMDGVIINSEPGHANAALSVLRKHNADVDISYCKGFTGSSTKSMCEDAVKRFGIDSTAEELLSEMNRAKKEIILKEGYPVIDGITELVKRLYKAGYKLAVASSSSASEIEDTVKALNIKKYFDKLVSSSNVKRPKPAPDIFELALSKLGVSAKETIVIEDSDFGIEAAKAAGIACAGYINPDSGEQLLEKADVLIESFVNLSVHFFEYTLQRSQGLPVNITSTKRLVIRELAVSDIKEIYPIYTDPQIRKYIENIDDYMENEIEKQKAYIQNVYSFYGYGLWGVFSKTTGRLIGRCGIENHIIDGKEEIMLSYLLDSQHWGYGYALECCNAVLRYAYEELDIHRIVAVIDTSNSRSINTAQKLGMKCEKEFMHNNRKSFLYAIVKD